MGPRAGRDQAHGGGLAVRPGDGGDRDRAQRRPRHVADRRQRVERPGLAARARAQRQRGLVEHVADAARRGASISATMSGRRSLAARIGEACECGCSSSTGGMTSAGSARIREIVLEQAPATLAQRAGSRSCTRRAQRPLVELGRREQLVDRRLQRERRAGRVTARHDRGRRGDPARVPAEMPARPLDARAPALRAMPRRRRCRPSRAPRPCPQRTGCRPAGDASRRGAGLGRCSVFCLRREAHAALVADQAGQGPRRYSPAKPGRFRRIARRREEVPAARPRCGSRLGPLLPEEAASEMKPPMP